MYGVCYLSDGDGEDNDDYYYWCIVFSGCEVWTIRFNMGMIHCGLTGGDSFSRNEGLVAVIYTCLSQFPKKILSSKVLWPEGLLHCHTVFPRCCLCDIPRNPMSGKSRGYFADSTGRIIETQSRGTCVQDSQQVRRGLASRRLFTV